MLTNEQRQIAEARLGLIYGLAAYLFWGVSPIYYKLLTFSAIDVLAHRVVWAVLLLGIILALQARFDEIGQTVRNRKVMLILIITTVLVSINWYTFIWAIGRGKVLQASLGYFITPLVQVILGVIFLRERLRVMQIVSFALASAGVAYLTWRGGELPWISISLAISFGFYALLRKIAHVAPLPGLTVETLLMLVPAVWFVGVGVQRDVLRVEGFPWMQYALTPFAGVVTAVPLLWFANAAKRLRLSTIGFLQYIAPTCQFLLAVLLYREPFTPERMISFGIIWAALAIYSVDSLRGYQREVRRREERTVEALDKAEL